MASNLLDYVTIKGFKSMASVEKLPIRPVNVLIGPNGSGKSNFIGVFAFLHEISQGRLKEYVAREGGAEKVLHFGSKTTKEIELELAFSGEAVEYRLNLGGTSNDGLFPSLERLFVRAPSGGHYPEGSFGYDLETQRTGEARISNPESPGGSWIRDNLFRWRVYHVHDTSFSSPMRKTARIHDNRFLRPDGSNLAAFLYYLQEKHRESYSLIRRSVQQVAPFFDDFRLEPLRLNPDDILLEWRHKNSDQYFDASSFSDGTLRFIALATLFLQPRDLRPSLILVDEPELGLHPYAIEILAALVRQASVETQVIVSTQSSLLVDHFAPEDVLVADRVNGGTQLTRLDPNRLSSWLEDYSLGQLWEKNELGGRPSPN